MYSISLGATTAPSTTDPRLKAGYEWFPYKDYAGKQLKTCPSVQTQGSYGCYMINGYAYGQRPKTWDNADQEFSAMVPKTVTQYTPPKGNTPNQCEAAYSLWLQMNPTMYSCAADQTAKAKFMSICAAGGSYGDAWQKYLATKCGASKPPPPPPAKTVPPTSVKPPSVPKQTSLPPDRGTPVNPPPPPPPLHDPGDLGDDTPVTQTKASPLRQLGPIVGIGLLVAVGLTLYRKKALKALTKRRRRR